MRLTKEEKEICKEYSARDKDGFVHCRECPLAIDKRSALCKRTITKQEWDARCKE
jgi:hypothetical protein